MTLRLVSEMLDQLEAEIVPGTSITPIQHELIRMARIGLMARDLVDPISQVAGELAYAAPGEGTGLSLVFDAIEVKLWREFANAVRKHHEGD